MFDTRICSHFFFANLKEAAGSIGIRNIVDLLLNNRFSYLPKNLL